MCLPKVLDENHIHLKMDDLKKNTLFAKITNELLECSPGLLLLSLPEQMSVEQLYDFFTRYGEHLGEAQVQNNEGRKLIEVYDRDPNRTMGMGARYHQTHEGGSIHTDNVNTPDPWDYLLFMMCEPAMKGGETLLVSGEGIYEGLTKQHPEVLKVLMEDFHWEKRGLSNQFYRAPIIKKTELGISFRYLRDYLVSAHERMNERLTSKQLFALDALDELMNDEEHLLRFKMKRGQFLIVKDDQWLHGRTPYEDFPDAVLPQEANKLSNSKCKRLALRMWIKSLIG